MLVRESIILKTKTNFFFAGSYLCFGENEVGTEKSDQVRITVLCEYQSNSITESSNALSSVKKGSVNEFEFFFS